MEKKEKKGKIGLKVMKRKLEGNEDEARRGRAPSKLPVWTEQTWHFQHVKKAFSRSKSDCFSR